MNDIFNITLGIHDVTVRRQMVEWKKIVIPALDDVKQDIAIITLSEPVNFTGTQFNLIWLYNNLKFKFWLEKKMSNRFVYLGRMRAITSTNPFTSPDGVNTIPQIY